MKRKALALTIILTLLSSAVAGILLAMPAKANFSYVNPGPNITIAGDGSISPDNQGIKQYENTYFLTSDIQGYGLIVERSNIVLDGRGFILNCTPYTNTNILLRNLTNVTVKNFQIQGGGGGINSVNCSNCQITGVSARSKYIQINGDNNIITNCSGFITLKSGSGNTVFRNTITDLNVESEGNLLYLNNIFDNPPNFFAPNNYLDNGSMGNYWMDYTTRYPNASEIDQTGIGDIPYIIDGNIDNYPLMYPWGVPPEIEILNAKNASYIEIFPLNFTVNKPTKWIGYSLNGEANVTVAGNVTLTDLEIGLHNVTVYAKDAFGNIGGSETFKFTMALVIHVLSPERRTYDTSIIPLIFTVNSALAQITYCLNGEKNVTISGNTTLNGLTNGDHNVTVYVMDKALNLKASETIYFTVEVPLPTTLVAAASVASAGVIAVGLVVYFKKRKH